MLNPPQNNPFPEKNEKHIPQNMNLDKRNYNPLPSPNANPPIDPAYQKYYYNDQNYPNEYHNLPIIDNSPPPPIFDPNMIPRPSFKNYNNIQLIDGFDSPLRMSQGPRMYGSPYGIGSRLQMHQINRNINPYLNSPPRLSLASIPVHPMELDNNRISPPRIAGRSISPPIIQGNFEYSPPLEDNRFLMGPHPVLPPPHTQLLHQEIPQINFSPPPHPMVPHNATVVLDSPSPPVFKQARASVIHHKQDYIEHEMEHHPVVRSRERITTIQKPNKQLRKKHKIPPPQFFQPPQPIQFTSNRGFQYPVTYKIGPARVRNPNEIHENITIVHSPEHYVQNENYIDYEPVVVPKMKSRIVQEPVIEEEEIVPQTVLATRKVQRPVIQQQFIEEEEIVPQTVLTSRKVQRPFVQSTAHQIGEFPPAVNGLVEYEPVVETYRRRNRLDISDQFQRNNLNNIKYSQYAHNLH